MSDGGGLAPHKAPPRRGGKECTGPLPLPSRRSNMEFLRQLVEWRHQQQRCFGPETPYAISSGTDAARRRGSVSLERVLYGPASPGPVLTEKQAAVATAKALRQHIDRLRRKRIAIPTAGTHSVVLDHNPQQQCNDGLNLHASTELNVGMVRRLRRRLATRCGRLVATPHPLQRILALGRATSVGGCLSTTVLPTLSLTSSMTTVKMASGPSCVVHADTIDGSRFRLHVMSTLSSPPSLRELLLNAISNDVHPHNHGEPEQVLHLTPLLTEATPTESGDRATTKNHTASSGDGHGEGWHHYCCAVSLYVALSDASCFGVSSSFPFMDVQRIAWADLVCHPQVRLELLSSGQLGSRAFLQRCTDKAAELTPVAITRPIRRKAVLRRLGPCGAAGPLPICTSPPSMTTEAFTDAEVFQLLYQQLLLRAYFDIRLPSMQMWMEPGRTGSSSTSGQRFLRADHIGVVDHDHQGLAFEHPCVPEHWLRFPNHSPQIVLMDLEHAVIPHLATESDVLATNSLPLVGSSPDVVCSGKVGRQAVAWAATQEICSPADAAKALLGLFHVFSAIYGCHREEVWRSAELPLRFGCRDVQVMEKLAISDEPIMRLVVSSEARQCLRVALESTEMVSCVPSSPKEEAGTDVFEEGEVAGTPRPYLTACSAASSLTSHPADDSGELLTQTPTEMKNDDSQRLSFSTMAELPSTFSPFTQRESLVSKWRTYNQHGCIELFNGATQEIQLIRFLGRGGSGIVYSGRYGKFGLPVAVKVFVKPDGMTHEAYVRESLTDVAFYVLLNQLDDFGIANAGRAHDFIVSGQPPVGLSATDAATARRDVDAAEDVPLCYLVTDLMDGTMGHFLGPEDDDYDPIFDTIINRPFRDAEMFQLLYLQLVTKAVFDWRVLDMMLHGQLRGDNIGYRYAQLSAARRAELEADPEEAAVHLAARRYYDGLVVRFQSTPDGEVRFLCFPSHAEDAVEPMRFIHWIDVGQGMQPRVEELTTQHLIGETVIDSCVNDDGFGRFWPLGELYSRYVETEGALAEEAATWAASKHIVAPEDAVRALGDLFNLFAPTYGISAERAEELRYSYLVITWCPHLVSELMKDYVYR